MSKWYNKPINVITNKRFISILLLSLTVLTYVIEKITEGEIVFTQFMLGLYIGQQIGYGITKIKK
jgi:hypothetical protein